MKRVLLNLFFLLFSGCVIGAPLTDTIVHRSSKSDFEEAEKLAKEANRVLQSGDLKAAKLLIEKSIEIYPVLEVFEYAKTLAKLPDILGSNMIMNKVTERVKALPDNIILSKNPNPFTINPFTGAPKEVIGSQDITEYEKNRIHFHFLEKSYNVNLAFADRKYILKSLKNLQSPVIIEKKGRKIYYDIEYSMQVAYKLEEAVYEGDFQKAQAILEATPIARGVSLDDSRKMILTRISMMKGDYLPVIEVLESSKQKNKLLNIGIYPQLFYMYSAIGNEKAMDNYNQMSPDAKENNRAYYSLALIDIVKKDFSAALNNLKTSSYMREKIGISAAMLVPNWDLYKSFGDVYAGLKKYDKARDNYEIALLYYENYKPAIEGLAKLQVNYLADQSTDKTPPVISITGPSPTRGLKVTVSGLSVMVKGMANDPSGLKEVTINGKNVYSQNNGNFWGDVAMVSGINKVTVTATDMAGNIAEKIFEIEKQEAPIVAATTDILPVDEQEGRNYCLLVAAQNYSDSQIPSLENPIQDAIKLKVILKEKYNFHEAEIISLFNPSGNDIKRKLLELTNTIKPEDNLLIFYAGHGIWVEKEKKGYWLMTDAKLNDVTTWLPNKDVLELIAKLPSRHTLLITDACFSGSVFKTRGLKAGAPTALREMDAKISRVAITSGNDTEVPDESVFMKYLVKALLENKEQYLTAQKMFINQIIEAVMTETKTEPRYGTLELAGHVGGDYIFSKK